MLEAIASISFHVEEAMAKLVRKALTGQHKLVDSRLIAALESLIEHFVKKAVILPEDVGHTVESIIDRSASTASTAVLVKSEEQTCTD